MNVNWVTFLENLVKIAGVAGFVLSIALAVIEWQKNKTKFSIWKLYLIPVGIDPALCDAAAWLDMTLVNRSANPVSIVGVDMKIGKIVIGNTESIYRYEYLDDLPVSFSVGTPLPFHLSAYDARKLVVAIPHQPIVQELLRLFGDGKKDLQVRLIFHTSKSSVSVRTECQKLDRNAYLQHRIAVEKASIH